MIGTIFKFVRSSRGNVAIIFAISAIPLIYMTGMGVDYSDAALRETQLDAIADAASLAAVTPAMLTQTDAASITAATDTFNAQASTLPGVTYNSTNLSVTVVDSITTRTVTVQWAAASQNFFPSVLGENTIALSGHSQSQGTQPPNINFYLLLDSSPSMALPATVAGINTMVTNTSSQGGCSFACHESYPAGDSLGNPGGEDNYALAKNLGLTLRIDNLRTAAENLMTTAQTTETADNATYQMAIYTFDLNFNTISAMTKNLTTSATDAANIQLLEVYDNNCPTSTSCNNDEDTVFDGSSGAMAQINTLMPNPGNGTNAAGDTPQEILFLVTDGVEDQDISGTRTYQMTTAECTTIKNRGIRIAVLYTTYYPLPATSGNAWYTDNIASFQPTIGTTLESCASPGLYYEVSTGGDISAALSSLFQEAVATAHLLK
jgi:Flp pilus assembly protein TadG